MGKNFYKLGLTYVFQIRTPLFVSQEKAHSDSGASQLQGKRIRKGVCLGFNSQLL